MKQHRLTTTLIAVTALGGVGALTNSAAAQPGNAGAPEHSPAPALPAATPAAKPATGDGSELAGPKVMPTVSTTSIVERNSMGGVSKLEMNPAEAALGKLTLSDAERDATHAIIRWRAQQFDELLKANTKEFLNVYNDFQAGRKNDAIKGLTELWGKATTIRAAGPLTDQLARVLSPENAKKLRAIVDEYAQAAVEDERAAAKSSGEGTSDAAINARVMFKSVGVELGNSYKRTVTQGAAEFDTLIKELALNGEQEAKLRTMVQEALLAGDPGVSDRERRQIFMTIWRDLNAEQREILTAKARGDSSEGRGKRKREPKAKD